MLSKSEKILMSLNSKH